MQTDLMSIRNPVCKEAWEQPSNSCIGWKVWSVGSFRRGRLPGQWQQVLDSGRVENGQTRCPGLSRTLF